MSAGAVFKLIANDGKADRMIMATKLLNQRIKDVMCARKAAGKADITPTLPDIERTHILFVNAHFKPFAAVGFEYNKVRPQSGSPSLSQSVTFSIPQFGDFFYDMVIRTRFSQFQCALGTTPVQAAGTTGSPSLFPPNGQTATGETAVGTYYNLVDAFGNIVVVGMPVGEANPAVNYRNLVRYVEYPGERLYNRVKFDVNGNPLDEYDQTVPVFLRKFTLTPNKVIAYKRLVGQEVALEGYGGVRYGIPTDEDVTTSGTYNTPSGIYLNTQGHGFGIYNSPSAGGAGYNGGAGVETVPFAAINETSSGSLVDISRELKQVVNGPQTPKLAQPPLEIWNRLNFWFNTDVRLAVPSVSIPFGQRFITVEMCTAEQLTAEFPNLYLETITEVATTPQAVSAATAFALSSITGPSSRTKTYAPIFIKSAINGLAIMTMEMYVNNIFVNPEIHDIYIKRIGFSLIRVYRLQNSRVNKEGTDEMLLSQIKWPVEYMFLGLRPTWNTRGLTTGTGGVVTQGNTEYWRDWHRFTKMLPVTTEQQQRAEISVNALATVPTIAAVGDLAASGIGHNALAAASSKIAGATSTIGQVVPDSYALPVPTVDTMSVTAHGIQIFDSFQDIFYNSYLPYHFGGPNIVSPDDQGALFINFALFPRSYQPSGHLNVSRARETYIKWTSSYISASTPAELLAVAIAINFLLITDGSAVLRYST